LEDPSFFILKLVGLGIFLLASAFFSGSEEVFFSLGEEGLERVRDGKRRRQLKKLLDRPRELLIDLLVGNTISNLLGSAICTSVFLSVCYAFGINRVFAVAMTIPVMTGLLLFFGEIFPKVFGLKFAPKIAPYVVVPFRFYSVGVSPVRYLLNGVAKFFCFALTKMKALSPFSVTEEEIRTLIRIGYREGILQREEQYMADSILRFSDKRVQDVMVGLPKMTIAPLASSLDEVLEVITKSGFSRIPIYTRSPDHILGIIHAKDFLPWLMHEPKRLIISQLLHPVIYVRWDERIDRVLHELQWKKMHVAIVVDSKKRTMGMVTLEDLIEEIVGEIEDEYDVMERRSREHESEKGSDR
jgi:CBS domain containing-hemolysin-like protein